jgi:hypothetical protein
MLAVVPGVPAALSAEGQPSSLIDRIVREGARSMLAAALQAEVAAYIGQFADVRDENGRRMVVRNGTAEPRTVVTSAGAVEVTAPRVNDKRADPHGQPDRVHLRHGQAPDQGHQGSRVEGGRAGDGVQAHRVRPGPLAVGECSSSGRAGTRRRPLRARCPGRAARTGRGVSMETMVVSAMAAGRGDDAAAVGLRAG